jgi:hypothetical protein
MTHELADYLVPVNADVAAVEVVLVDEEDDEISPVGVKGVGEIDIRTGGKLGLVFQHHRGLRFCRKACKENFLAKTARDHACMPTHAHMRHLANGLQEALTHHTRFGWGVVTTPQPPDAARRPASSAGRCRPSAAPRVRSVNGPQDSGQPQ